MVVTSNRGLAGGLNSNVTRMVQELLQGELAGVHVEMVEMGMAWDTPGSDGKIAVSLWLAHDARMILAGGAREVA